MYALIASILWSAFFAAMIASIAGLLADLRGRRNLALIMFAFAVVITLGFSYAAGFSIGRFTAIIPVLIAGYVAGIGRGLAARVAGVLAAAIIYVAFSWLLSPLAATSSALGLVFGLWAIPLYALLALAAFVWALVRPSRRRDLTPR